MCPIPGCYSVLKAVTRLKSVDLEPSQPSFRAYGKRMFPISTSVFAEVSTIFPRVFGNCFRATMLWPGYLFWLMTSASHTMAAPPLPRRPTFLKPCGHLSPNFSCSDPRSKLLNFFSTPGPLSFCFEVARLVTDPVLGPPNTGYTGY